MSCHAETPDMDGTWVTDLQRPWQTGYLFFFSLSVFSKDTGSSWSKARAELPKLRSRRGLQAKRFRPKEGATVPVSAVMQRAYRFRSGSEVVPFYE